MPKKEGSKENDGINGACSVELVVGRLNGACSVELVVGRLNGASSIATILPPQYFSKKSEKTICSLCLRSVKSVF